VEQRAETLRLGGMALRNGLLVHGPTHWAAAVRCADGSLGVASGPKPRMTGIVATMPGLAAVIRLGEAMAIIPLVKRALPEARLPFQDRQVLGLMAAAAVTGSLVRRRAGGVRGEAAAAAISLVPSLAALRGGDLAAYHGVEHKAIAAYEHGDQDAADAAKEHDRCGSHLMAPLLAANIAGRRVAQETGRPSTSCPRRGAVARVGRAGRRGVRLERAPPDVADGESPACPGARASAGDRHARADGRAAGGRACRPGRDPAGGGLKLREDLTDK
jgi:hypothetical protein